MFGPLKATVRLMWPPGENEFDTPGFKETVSIRNHARSHQPAWKDSEILEHWAECSGRPSLRARE